MSDAPNSKSPEPEGLSFKVIVSSLPKAGMPIRFVAKPEERLALARLLDIPAIDRLEADILLSRWRAEGIAMTGRLEADVVQTDVVTLEPLAQKVVETIDRVFVPDHSRLERIPDLKDGELHLDPEGDDIPDTFSGDRLDVGAVLAEVLALGLDPYPRSGSVVFEAVDTDPEPAKGVVSPFAGLARLKPSEE